MSRDAWNSHLWSSQKPRQVEIEPDKPLRQHHCSRCGRDFVRVPVWGTMGGLRLSI